MSTGPIAANVIRPTTEPSSRLSRNPSLTHRLFPNFCAMLFGKRSAGICIVLGPKKSSTYCNEYASGFFAPAASHLPAPPLPHVLTSFQTTLRGDRRGRGGGLRRGFQLRGQRTKDDPGENQRAPQPRLRLQLFAKEVPGEPGRIRRFERKDQRHAWSRDEPLRPNLNTERGRRHHARDDQADEQYGGGSKGTRRCCFNLHRRQHETADERHLPEEERERVALPRVAFQACDVGRKGGGAAKRQEIPDVERDARIDKEP